MNQSGVIRAVARREAFPIVTVHRTMRALFSTKAKHGVIVECLCLGEKVILPGFGTLYIEVRDAQNYRDPVTGELRVSPARHLIKFRTSESLQALLDASFNPRIGAPPCSGKEPAPLLPRSPDSLLDNE